MIRITVNGAYIVPSMYGNFRDGFSSFWISGLGRRRGLTHATLGKGEAQSFNIPKCLISPSPKP